MHIVRRVNFETAADGASVLTLADHEDARGRTLTFRRAPGDAEPTISNDGGASATGGIRSAAIEGWHLRLALAPETAAELGLPEEVDLFLELARDEAVTLRDALPAILG
jgi:hypothetical protein